MKEGFCNVHSKLHFKVSVFFQFIILKKNEWILHFGKSIKICNLKLLFWFLESNCIRLGTIQYKQN